jgi:hypothetical protein
MLIANRPSRLIGPVHLVEPIKDTSARLSSNWRLVRLAGAEEVNPWLLSGKIQE